MKSRLKNRIDSSFIVFGSLIIIVVMTLIYLDKTNKDWKKTPQTFNLRVYLEDSLINNNIAIFPLKLETGNITFSINDTSQIQIFKINLNPRELTLVLKTTEGIIISTDSLKYDGAKDVHYYIRRLINCSNSIKAKIDLMEFYPL